jgi:predicted DNA-binding transcriptional regulator AlpA
MATKSPTFGTANAPEPQPLGTRRLITQKQLPEKGINYHPNHIRRMWHQGKFPRPVYISERRFAWPEEVIDRWIDAKIAEQAA